MPHGCAAQRPTHSACGSLAPTSAPSTPLACSLTSSPHDSLLDAPTLRPHADVYVRVTCSDAHALDNALVLSLLKV